jgi:hypothetical protein
MGKFDRTLEGEKKPRGTKRKVRVNAMPPPPPFNHDAVVLDALCAFLL